MSPSDWSLTLGEVSVDAAAQSSFAGVEPGTTPMRHFSNLETLRILEILDSSGSNFKD